jgi:hypothetical protein
MYRSGWGTKPGQEVTLAIRMQRAGFDQLLRETVHSSFVADIYGDQVAWADTVARSAVGAAVADCDRRYFRVCRGAAAIRSDAQQL